LEVRVIDFFTVIGMSVVGGVLLSCAWYAIDLLRASRRDRRKWDALARQEQREAVERALRGDTPPPEDVRTIYW
jgi:hypothetical protein